MLTLILGTVILALTFGAFWQNQPARGPNNERGEPGFRLGRLVNRALEWLVLMPHLSNPAETKEPSFLTGKCVMPDRQPTSYATTSNALGRPSLKPPIAQQWV
jgi:hypothetical protein